MHLTENAQTMLMIALNTHIKQLNDEDASDFVMERFTALEHRLGTYDAVADAAGLDKLLRLAGLHGDLRKIEDAMVGDLDEDAAYIVSLMDEDHVLAIYEACCERLNEDADLAEDLVERELNHAMRADEYDVLDLGLSEADAKLADKVAQERIDFLGGEKQDADAGDPHFIDKVFGGGSLYPTKVVEQIEPEQTKKIIHGEEPMTGLHGLAY